MTERTWPLFPSGFTGMSLIFKVRPAPLPTDRDREFSAGEFPRHAGLEDFPRIRRLAVRCDFDPRLLQCVDVQREHLRLY